MEKNEEKPPYIIMLNIRNPHNMQIKTLTIPGVTNKEVIKKTIEELTKLLKSEAVHTDFGIITKSPVTIDYEELQADTSQDERVRIRAAKENFQETTVNILKFYCRGWSYQKIADRFNISIETVKSGLHRACKKMLKKTLKEMKDFLTGAVNKSDNH